MYSDCDCGNCHDDELDDEAEFRRALDRGQMPMIHIRQGRDAQHPHTEHYIAYYAHGYEQNRPGDCSRLKHGEPGRSMAEAVGYLVMAYPELFSVLI